MRIFFLSHFFYPHVGGVEKHVLLLLKELIKKGHNVSVITERFDAQLKSTETVEGIKVIRIDYPKQKYLGIFNLWLVLWKMRSQFLKADIIHIHDVFIWYIPFRFLFPGKKVFVTIHGLEWGNPFSKTGIFQKKIAVKLSSGSIGVGKFLEKYINTKFNLLIYGATNSIKTGKKKKNCIVFVGRLSKDTGVLKFLEYLKRHKKLKVSFVGDGEYRKVCEKYGKVYGFTDPDKFYADSEYAVPGGYLACLEAMSAKCKIKVFWSDNLKEDYWKMSPMYEFIQNGDIEASYEWVKQKNWTNLVNQHIKLWNL